MEGVDGGEGVLGAGGWAGEELLYGSCGRRDGWVRHSNAVLPWLIFEVCGRGCWFNDEMGSVKVKYLEKTTPDIRRAPCTCERHWMAGRKSQASAVEDMLGSGSVSCVAQESGSWHINTPGCDTITRGDKGQNLEHRK